MALAVTAGVLPSAAHAAPADRRLASVNTFAFAIGDGTLRGDVVRRYRDYRLVVVDGQGGDRARFAASGAPGIVVGYVSVGTVESWRPWYGRAKRYALEPYDDWPGERYADTSAAGYRRLIAGSVAPALLRKGLDGLFLDNVDMVREHRAQRRGMFTLVRQLRKVVDRAPGRYLFAQNGEDVIGPVVPMLDGWNREDVTATYDHDGSRYALVSGAERRAAVSALRRFRARGLLVTSTDYTGSSATASARSAVRVACSAGAIPFVSDISLRRIPARAPRCAPR
ncbi:MAG: endo alpha-1,4 polygalactosaminidase [Thermoleophilia bacterium]